MDEFGYDNIQRAAMAYVLEDRMWRKFVRWVAKHHASEAARKWAESNPDVDILRYRWMAQSNDQIISIVGLINSQGEKE